MWYYQMLHDLFFAALGVLAGTKPEDAASNVAAWLANGWIGFPLGLAAVAGAACAVWRLLPARPRTHTGHTITSHGQSGGVTAHTVNSDRID